MRVDLTRIVSGPLTDADARVETTSDLVKKAWGPDAAAREARREGQKRTGDWGKK
jgi:hypothetical protein